MFSYWFSWFRTFKQTSSAISLTQNLQNLCKGKCLKLSCYNVIGLLTVKTNLVVLFSLVQISFKNAGMIQNCL